VLQNDRNDAMGEQGCGLGYAGIKKSLAIEFDTYCTYDRCNDPDGNHVSVHTRYTDANSSHHDYSLKCTQNLDRDLAISINDNKIHKVKIVYDTPSKRLHVSLDEMWILQNVEIDLSKVFGSDEEGCWIGFTASTGGLSEAHDILSFSIVETTLKNTSVEYVSYPAANIAGIRKKMVEFNDGITQGSLTGMELNNLNSSVLIVLEQSSGTIEWTQREHDIIFKMLLNWPVTKQFPALDMLRVCFARYPATMAKYYSHRSLWKELLLNKPQQPAANRMIMYRLLCNLFASDALRSTLVRDHINSVFDCVLDEGTSWAIQPSDKGPVREPYVALLYNFTCMFASVALVEDDQDSLVRLTSAITCALNQEVTTGDTTSKMDDKAIHLLLRSLVILLHMEQSKQEDTSDDNLIKGLLLSMDIEVVLQFICADKSQTLTVQTKDVAKNLTALISK